MSAPQRTKRRYGMPWAGYQSSVPPHMAQPDKATSDGPSSSRRSQNFLYNPLEGKFYRREGMSVNAGSTGILEDGPGELTVARCRQMLSMRSPSLTDGYPTHASLWTEEGNHKGCVYFRNTNNGGLNQVLGSEFGTTGSSGQYPQGTTGTFYMIPWPYMRTTDGTIGRFNTLALRAMASAGSRRVLEMSDRLHSPNLNGTPWYWDKYANDVGLGDTTDRIRIQHTGRPSPLGLPTVDVGTVSSTGSWHEGDKFYVSVAYLYDDGSVSMPIIPRDRNDYVNLALNGNHTGFGLVSLARSGAPSTDRYYDLTWTTIPIGPKGVVGRYLLRSPKLNGTVESDGSTAATEGTEPSPLDLRICGFIGNNTDTSWRDPNGNDLSLTTDPLLVRFDHIMQPPARYISTCDNRAVVGYTKPNPVAIYLAPNVNVIDTDATIDNVDYSYTLSGGTLTLYKDAGSTTITNIGTKSVQRVVDEINNTVGGGGGGKWWAAVAPGADAAALCDNTATAAANGNLTSITGATDYAGDDAGRVRCFAPSFPGCIFFSTTYLANFPTQKRRIFFTMGGAGMPANAGASFAAGNFRTAPESWGDYMGSAPLANGAVMCFSKAIGVLQNRRGGTTGADEDYRLYDLNVGRGCIAYDSIVEFNGAVGYLTTDGFVVTDGKEEVVISGDVWNPGTQTGEWAYEIGQCAEAAASDTDIARFSAKVMGGKLYVAFRLHNSGTGRTLATDAHPNYWMVYDFTGSMQYSGLRGVLRQDGTPWGWSTPLTVARSAGPMCEVVTSSGVVRFMADEDSTGQDSNGRIYQIETGVTDAGTDYNCKLWTCRDLSEHLRKKAAQELISVHKKSWTAPETGTTITLYRDGLGTTSDASITLPSTSSANFETLVLPLPMAARAPAKSHEYLITDDGSSTDPTHTWGFEADLLLLDSY